MFTPCVCCPQVDKKSVNAAFKGEVHLKIKSNSVLLSSLHVDTKSSSTEHFWSFTVNLNDWRGWKLDLRWKNILKILRCHHTARLQREEITTWSETRFTPFIMRKSSLERRCNIHVWWFLKNWSSENLIFSSVLHRYSYYHTCSVAELCAGCSLRKWKIIYFVDFSPEQVLYCFLFLVCVHILKTQGKTVTPIFIRNGKINVFLSLTGLRWS